MPESVNTEETESPDLETESPDLETRDWSLEDTLALAEKLSAGKKPVTAGRLRKKLLRYAESELGLAALARCPGTNSYGIASCSTPEQREKFDIRVGWPNIPADWEHAEGLTVTDGRTAAGKRNKLFRRLDTLDDMNAACEGLNLNDAWTECTRIWRKAPKPVKTAPEVKVARPHDEYRLLVWHGVTLEWWEYGLTFEVADSLVQLLWETYLASKTYEAKSPELTKDDIGNLARNFGHSRVWYSKLAGETAGGTGVCALIGAVTTAMANNPEAVMTPRHMKYHKEY